ncbi:rRNA adenine N-6-methyltransferase family protein [soil metagenome]
MTPSPAPKQAPTTARTPASQKGADWWLVFRKFLKHGTSIATFVPSSKFLARSMMKGIDFEKAGCIVELGAGTGPITVELLKRVKPHTKLLIVELDADFCVRLREKFPNADIIEGDAAHLDDLLAKRGIKEVDHVISGLPLPSFSTELRNSIIASSMKVLSPTGSFRQLTNMPYVYWKLYKKYFTDVRFKLVPLNFPPAGVYVCKSDKV